MIIGRREFISGIAAVIAVPSILQAVERPTEVARIWAANQTGYQLTVFGLPESFLPGDIITIEGVEAADRFDKRPLGYPRQFVVTHGSEQGTRLLYVYPSLIPVWLDERYGTVIQTPEHNAVIRKVTFNNALKSYVI